MTPFDPLPDSAALPPLRDDLRLQPAPPGPNGQPCWHMLDPLRQRTFLIGDGDVKLLSLWACGSVGALRQALASHGIGLDEAQLGGLIDFLTQHHLVQADAAGGAAALLQTAQKQQSSGWRWALQQYLGMRFALWRPQAFLQRSLPLLAGLWSRPVVAVWALATLLGLLLVARQWDSFVGTFANFFTPGGVLAYGTALLLLKLLHELGHAYAAVHHGCHVSSMGVTVAMGMPMLYTDTSDASRLLRRSQRMWVAAGGVLAETGVAGLATLAWGLLPDGNARSIAFVLATSSWLMSLLVNCNPFSRFDGYYFVSDWLGIHNLQSRALAYAGWAAGRALLGQAEAPPEQLPRRAAVGFSLYGAAVWGYRVSLSLAMAAVCYAYVFKLAGLLLGALTLWMQVGTPLLRRAGHWWGLRGGVTRQRRLGLAAVMAVLALMVLLPLDRSVAVPAMLGWQDQTVLQAPENARVLAVHVQPGQAVAAGQVLLQLDAPELHIRRAQANIQRLSSGQRLARISGDAQDRASAPVLAQQRNEADADLAGLNLRSAQLQLRAPRSGVVVDLPPHLQAGQWVRPDLTLARVLHGNAVDVHGYVAARDLPRLQPGAHGRFVPADGSRASWPITLREIEPAASETITPPALSTLHGGPVAARQDGKGREVPVLAQHRLRFSVAAPAAVLGVAPGAAPALVSAATLPTSMLGEVQVDAESQSLAQQAGRQLWRLLMAELRG